MAGVTQRNKVDVQVRKGAITPVRLADGSMWPSWRTAATVHLYRNGVKVASVPCDGVYRRRPIQHLTIGCQNGGGIQQLCQPRGSLAGPYR